MKVAIVVPVFVTGGAENMAAQLAVHLKKQGTDVEVISMYPRQGHIFEERIEAAGIPLHFMNKQGKGSAAAMVRLWKLLNTIKPDVVHTHIYATFYSIPWILFHRSVQIHTIHTCPGKDFPRYLDFVLSIMVKIKKMVLVAVSEKNKTLAETHYRVAGDRVCYVNNPVELEKFRIPRKRTSEDIVFINLSRQDNNKNQIMAIRALKNILPQIPNARLVLLGDGPRHEMLKQTVAEWDLLDVVSFPGECKTPEDYLVEADVYVSTSNNEGLPLSMLEAEAAGLPVIATQVGGVGDIVKNNGVLIEPRDQEALEREMLRFARDPQLRKKCAEVSGMIVKEYDAEACARKYLEIYHYFYIGKH